MTDEHAVQYKIRALRTVENLNHNNFEAYFFDTKDEACSFVKNMLQSNATIGVGGSKTLDELGLLDIFRKSEYSFFDRYDQKKSKEEIEEIKRNALLADFFFFSSNAVTEDGCLVNIDGSGNRLAALVFGPKQVVVVCGVNKITKDVDEAVMRVRTVAAPMNARRLSRKTPCVVTGQCEDCSSPDRICSNLVITEKIMHHQKGRVKVILINEELGF